MRKLIPYILVIGLFICIADGKVYAQCRDDTRSKVEAIINNIFAEKTLNNVTQQFREIGPAAVPCVLEYMSRDGYKRPAIRIIFLNFVSKSEGVEVEAALMKLLKDTRPELRGYAASELGRRRVFSAIPLLIDRLDDNENTVVICTLNNSCDDIPVRVLAMSALESITGVKPSNSKSKEKQAKAWRQWWSTRQIPKLPNE
jgi:hypothetical protein